jgi:thiamine pyrophosphokinase
MSSHHIVRDNQEPALLLLDGESILYSLVQDFLEWSPAIMVNEPLVDEVLLWGIKIDTAICEEKNLTVLSEKIKDQVPVKFITYKRTEEIMDNILDFLNQGNYSSINIFSDDSNLFSVLENQDSKINIVLIQNKRRWSLIRSKKFEKWVSQGMELIFRKKNEEKIILPDTQNRISIQEKENFWIGENL